jgi:decaprenylphospho-beta-D-erythro-pentofuranosid-2-ulose 2-reductase
MIDGLGRPQTALVLGATSDIAIALVDRLVHEGTERFVLAARRPAELAEMADGLQLRGAATFLEPFDAIDLAGHRPLIARAARLVGDLDVIVVAFGSLGPPTRLDQQGAEDLREIAHLDFVAAASCCHAAAERLVRQGHGVLVVLSSAAALRARPDHLAYGAAKAGLDAYVRGLMALLRGTGARAMLVRAGFVPTKMTAGLTPPPLSTIPEAVAAAITTALRQGREIVWCPRALRVAMPAVRALPTRLFRRLVPVNAAGVATTGDPDHEVAASTPGDLPANPWLPEPQAPA